MQKISDARNDNDAWWGSHFPYEGDLVGMSYLYFEKSFHKPKEKIYTKADCNKDSINLVIWGDSYTQYMSDSCFCAAGYQYGRRYFSTMKCKIDSTKRNILIIEITERGVRGYFNNTDMFNHVECSAGKVVTDCTISPTIRYAAFKLPSINRFFNKHINQNLEYNLFNYNFMYPFRGSKAWINYKLFHRASGNVAISDNGDRLFLKETIQHKGFTGYGTTVSEEEVNNIVSVLNDINNHYKQAGFDAVYLSIIPNAVTIYQPEGYNMLIPRIQMHPALQMKCLDVYSIYKKSPEGMYWRGDTHWSSEGANVWLKLVNSTIMRP